MKNFRILLPTLVISICLFTTGCKTWNDFWGISSDEEVDIAVDDTPILEEDADLPTDWTEPGESIGGIDDLIPISGVKLPAIYFSYDKDNLGTSEKRKLDQVANYLNSNAGIYLIIEGHCDERGSLEYNRSLGERRALSVKDYLATVGVPAERLRTISFGEEKPAVGGTGETVFSKNRRAELIAAKKK